MDVEDLRAAERFILAQPLPGTYGATSIVLVNISAQGAQVAHGQPLRLGSKGRLVFKHLTLSVTSQGLTIWSRYGKAEKDDSTLVYRSGIRIESDVEQFAAAVKQLIDWGVAQPDPDSLERKRRRLLDRNADKTSRLIVRTLKPDVDIPNDQVLLIQHARERLRANPDEALKWYNRAKFEAAAQVSDAIPNREEVLAVWEYLERSVDVTTIAMVFERLRKV